MMKLFLYFAAITASLFIAIAPARTCTPISGYQAPTNLELVAQADLIMLARIGDGIELEDARRRVGEEPTFEGAISVTPLMALKGDLPEPSLTIPDTYIATPSEYHLAFPSNPYDLREAHPEAFAGGCARSTFLQGRTVVFFLSQMEDGVLPVNYAFSRWAEDVPSADAPWVRAIRIYVEVLELPEDERQAALITARDRLLAMDSDLDAVLIAADIDRQLADWDLSVQDATPSEGGDAALQSALDMEAAADDAMREMEEEAATYPKE
jgi:hypothetical protein